MTNSEIKNQIDGNNKLIKTLSDPTQFTLNGLIANLLLENAKLQQQCTHEFKDGKCIYCYMEETK